MSKVILEINQASSPRDGLQMRTGREQEVSVWRESFMLLSLKKAMVECNL